MKAKDFRALLAELGALTSVQRNALMTALSSRRSAGDVVALIEAEFAKAPACGHCGSDAFNRWGVATGMANLSIGSSGLMQFRSPQTINGPEQSAMSRTKSDTLLFG